MKHVVWISLICLIFIRYLTTKTDYIDGDKVRITTIVKQDVVRYERNQYLKIMGLKVYLPLFPDIKYGDQIVVEGVVENGKLSDAKLISVFEIENPLVKFRNGILEFYSSHMPQPMSGLLGGIVLGSKSGLSNDFYQKAINTGVVHVVVASGTNISFLVSMSLGFLTKFINRRKAIYYVIFICFLYLIISGFNPPLIRASLMASCLFVAQAFGRVVNSYRILFLSALIMLAVNPLWLFDVSFLLSFSATLSLLLFEPRISEKLKKLPNFIKNSLSTTLAAQIGVLPILIFIFRYFNILSVMVNVLVLWTIPYIMVFGGLAGLVKSETLLLITYPFLWWFSAIVELFTF